MFFGDFGGFFRFEALEGGEFGIGDIMVLIEFVKKFGGGEEVVGGAVARIVAPHVIIGFGKVALVAANSSERIIGTASVNNRAIKRFIPVVVIRTERADGADGATGRVLENGSKTRNSCFRDGFENNLSFVQADLWAGAVLAIRNLHTENGEIVIFGILELFTR